VIKMEAFSDLMKSIAQGKFVYTGELEPHKSVDISEVVDWARTLRDTGRIVAANVTDNPRSVGAISSLAASFIIQRETGLEMVYQLRASDRNRLALTSDLLGAAALGIRNVLCLTGDHTSMGDNKESMPVFDLDSAQLVKLTHMLVYEGKDLAGNEVHGPKPRINIGAVANPGQEQLEMEVLKLERKVQAGVEFIQTQVVFDAGAASKFLDEVKNFGVAVLIGIFPPKTYAQADFFDKYVPGVKVPPEMLGTLKKFKEIENKEERKKKINEYNTEYFVDFIKEIKKKSACKGCHIMAVGYPDVIKPIIDGVK